MTTIKQKGFSLIELMIAMVIGLVLLGGIVSVFSSSRKSFDLTQDISVVQQGARYSIDEISRNIRIAGFQGCAMNGVAESQVRAQVSPTNNLFATFIQGAEVTNSKWIPSRHPMLADLSPEPIVGSDVLMLQYGSPNTSGLAVAMATPGSPLSLANNNAALAAGDLAIISDCLTSDLFRISTATSSGGAMTITHTATQNTDGNLSKSYAPGSSAAINTTTLMKFNFTTYYVGDTGRTNTHGDAIYSLYSYDIAAIDDPAGKPTELIEGVENMQLLYGIRSATNSTVRYVSSDSASYDQTLIESVQLGLLIASAEASTDNPDEKTYDLLGTEIPPGNPGGSTPTHAEDHRIRMAFSSTIKVRNRR